VTAVDEQDSSRLDAARYIGARTRRKEDPRLLSGQGSYVGDVVLPGMGHVAFVRSPYPRATIVEIGVKEAEGSPGVLGVLTGRDLSAEVDVPKPWRNAILPIDYVSYVGEPIVMVIAESRAQAEDGAELVEITYEVEEPVIALEDAIADLHIAHHGDTTNYVESVANASFATVDEVIAQAPHVFSETLQQHRYVHSPMETRGVVARWQSAAQQMTIWISTQGAHPAVAHFAKILRLAHNNVRVVVGDVGGAFGQKIAVTREETSIAIAAKILRRPVKWIEDRYENLVAGPHARRELVHVSVATEDDGTLIAMKVDHVQDVGSFGGVGGGNFDKMIPGPYRCPVVGTRTSAVRTNTSSRAAYRGPWMMETLLRETMMDVAAKGLGLDPLEIRRRNILHRDDLPHTTGCGQTYDLITADETLERAIAILGYEDFRIEQARLRAEGRYLGVGISVVVEPSGMSVRRVSDGVAVRIDDSGKVMVATGSGSQGHSVETTICQVVADHLGVDIADIHIVIGDTAATPSGGTTGGSRNAIGGGNSAMKAAVELRTKMLEIASHALEASPEDLEIKNGVVSVAGVPTLTKTFAEIAAIASTQRGVPEGMEPGLETLGRYTTDVPSTFSNATHIAVCEVEIDTGRIHVRRFIVSEDCGVIINPNVVEGQIAGGVIQGIGGVLYENFIYDANGNPLTTTYLDYLIPTSAEVPEIEYDHLETVAPTNPGGFKGMGEGGAIAAPAAIINAVVDALTPFGVTKITDQPLSPQRVLEIINNAKASIG
jgi:carbon-monoxide dehydrogenase large subunit